MLSRAAPLRLTLELRPGSRPESAVRRKVGVSAPRSRRLVNGNRQPISDWADLRMDKYRQRTRHEDVLIGALPAPPRALGAGKLSRRVVPSIARPACIVPKDPL